MLASCLQQVSTMTPGSRVRIDPFDSADVTDIRAVIGSNRQHIASVEQVIDQVPREVREQVRARLSVVECRLERLTENISTLAHLAAGPSDPTASRSWTARD